MPFLILSPVLYAFPPPFSRLPLSHIPLVINFVGRSHIVLQVEIFGVAHHVLELPPLCLDAEARPLVEVGHRALYNSPWHVFHGGAYSQLQAVEAPWEGETNLVLEATPTKKSQGV